MHRKLSKKWKHSFSRSADENDTKSNSIEIAFKSDDIIKQGYLYKKSTHFKKIRKRWMVLKRDHLYSYKQTNKPTERLDLSIYDTVRIVDCGKYIFELSSTRSQQKHRTFIAKSDDERKQWVETIKALQTNRLYQNWKYEKKSFKTKADKAQKIGFSKTKIKTALMNKTPEIHNPTDDPSDSDDNDFDEQCEIISAYKSEIVLDQLDVNSKEIMNQLSKFGYSKSESIEAMNNVSNKNDINSITTYIESKRQKSLTTRTAKYTQDFTNPEEWESILNTMCSTIPSEQQLLILLELKILAERMLTNKKKYQTLNLSDKKLQQILFNFDGGLVFLYQLGFEHDAVIFDMLVCNKLNVDVVKACVECLEYKMILLSSNVNFNYYRRGTVSDNIMTMSFGTPILNKAKSIFPVTTETKMEFDLTQSMPVTGPNMKQTYFEQWRPNSFETQNETNEGKNSKSEINDGATKQFYNFLSENNLEKYFPKFLIKECCDIRDIEYLLDDEKFLEKEIGIKNSFHRKKLLDKCKKLKLAMDNFENSNIIPTLIFKQLRKHGIVTMDILCNEIKNKSDLKIKYGINDDSHCDLVWNIVNLQSNDSNTPHNDLQQEGIQNVQSNETNFFER